MTAGERARLCLLAAILSLALCPVTGRAQEADPPTAAESSGAAFEPDASVEVIDVLARRESLLRTTQIFVASITHTDGETLARWRQPVCPTVSGVAAENAEFVRKRILEIAAGVGAPLPRKSTCQTNLFVVLTDQPAKVLDEWMARNPRMFGGRSKTENDGSRSTSPVRIWHGADLNNADGSPPKEVGLGMREYRLKDSRISRSVAEDISLALILVDTTKTGTATFGQLADYLAMVSLARLDPDADVAGSSTMLGLFAPSTKAPPARLTDWDEAFLRALYGPSATMFEQRDRIAASMAKDLMP
jgi:hypothetical protein